MVCAPIGTRPFSNIGHVLSGGRGGGPRVCAHAPRRGNYRCTSVTCVSQNHGLGYQPTIQTMQDDSPSSQQGLLLGWARSLCPACYGGAPGVPGQAPTVHGRRDRLTGSSGQSAGGHRLRADGDKARCQGDWPNHGIHGSPAEASMAYLRTQTARCC